MTPRQLKEALISAADSNDSVTALQLIKEFKQSGWWIWEGKAGKLDGTEKLRKAVYDGHCQICDQWFEQGSEIRWRAGACAHPKCWQSKFGDSR